MIMGGLFQMILSGLFKAIIGGLFDDNTQFLAHSNYTSTSIYLPDVIKILSFVVLFFYKMYL